MTAVLKCNFEMMSLNVAAEWLVFLLRKCEGLGFKHDIGAGLVLTEGFRGFSKCFLANVAKVTRFAGHALPITVHSS